MKGLSTFLIIFMFLSGHAFSDTLKLKYFQSDNRYNYRIALLKLAMENTLKSDGTYLLEPVKEKMTQKRGIDYLLKGEDINIGFFPSTKERETMLLSIKIPILRGLLGYRVFIIRKDRLGDFIKINSLHTLKTKFKAGFGDQWADMEILKINNIPVIGTPKYKNLFAMLSGRRFDYFPRGVNEAWEEISEIKEHYPDLMVEPHIALYYPYPVYYYVNKKNLKLADRIERGLTISIEDGSFKKLFLQYHDKIIQQADLKNRKLFILKNPTLLKQTQIPDTSWWSDL